MPGSSPSTRDRILAAAAKLFYAEGLHAVTVDAVAERAGVTKKTVYYHFRSKDDLIAGYLDARDQPNLKLMAEWYDAAPGDPGDKVAALFARLAVSARHPKWKGCGFLRTVAELANKPGHPARQIGARHKRSFEAWLKERFAEAGLAEPARRARHVALLLDGAFAAMLTHCDASYAEAAGDAARTIVRA